MLLSSLSIRLGVRSSNFGIGIDFCIMSMTLRVASKTYRDDIRFVGSGASIDYNNFMANSLYFGSTGTR